MGYFDFAKILDSRVEFAVSMSELKHLDDEPILHDGRACHAAVEHGLRADKLLGRLVVLAHRDYLFHLCFVFNCGICRFNSIVWCFICIYYLFFFVIK